jgi:L-cysteine desulfidase
MVRICPGREAATPMTRFQDGDFVIGHAGVSAMVAGLPGWRCDGCEGVAFDPDSARR